MTTAAAQGFQGLLQSASQRLARAGIPDGRREAELLIARVLDCTRLELYRSNRLTLDSTQVRTFDDLIRRRARREPLQYILGTQEFWGMEFRVTSDTLVPRPETERLIEAVLGQWVTSSALLRLADLGTGTGCLAVTLAAHYPAARVFATDISPAALAVARSNAARHGLSGRIEFLEGDLLEPLKALNLHHALDGIVANPPYVPSAELNRLQPEVRDYEPRLALNGGPDGLDYYRRILPRALDFLRGGGFLFLEVGILQAAPILALAERSGWRPDRVMKDLQKIDRVVVLEKP